MSRRKADARTTNVDMYSSVLSDWDSDSDSSSPPTQTPKDASKAAHRPYPGDMAPDEILLC